MATEEIILKIRADIGEGTRTVGELNKQFAQTRKNTKVVSESILGMEQELKRLRLEASKLKTTDTRFKELSKEIQQTEMNLKNAKNQFKQTTGTMNQLSAAISRNRKEAKGLNLETKEGAKRFSQLSAEIKKDEQRLIGLQRQLTKNQTFVGEYARGITQSFKNIGFAITSAFSVFAIINFTKESIKVLREFEQQMARVEAISGATEKEFEALSISAKELGRTTQFTATQVGMLQEELSKLGFSSRETLQATEAILQLATAMQSDLAESATVVGATIRAFQLDASETQRVVDVMAESFSGSALDLQKFSVAMAQVAPVAQTFGFSVEETTALLGKLTDAGFDASRAGTATRNIMLNLADSTGKLAKALGEPVKDLPSLVAGLKRLDERGIDLNETLQLTDKRSVAAFNQFIATADATQEFADKLGNAEGAAKRMSDIVADTLEGDIRRLTSAWEGLILTQESSNGFFRGTVQLITDAITGITTLIKEIKILSNIEIRTSESLIQLNEQFEDANRLVREYQRDVNTATETIKQLNNGTLKTTNLQGDLNTETKALSIATINLNTQLLRRSEIQARLNSLNDESNKQSKEGKEDDEDKDEAEKNQIRNAFELNRLIKEQTDIINGENTSIEQTNRALSERIKLQKELRAILLGRDVSDLEEVEQAKIKSDQIIEIRQNEVDQLGLIEKQREVDTKAVDKSIADERRKLNKEFVEDATLQLELTAQGIDTISTFIEASFNRQIQAAGDNEVEQERIRKEFGAKFKRAATAEAIINTALAITKIAAQTGVLSPIPIALAVANGAAQVALIQSQKFRDGGHIPEGGGFIEGNSHAAGGVKFKAGGVMHEAEGGEIIVNKNIQSRPDFVSRISEMNAATGGKRFQRGDIIGASRINRTPDINLDSIVQQIAQIKPVVSVSEFRDVEEQIDIAEESATL